MSADNFYEIRKRGSGFEYTDGYYHSRQFDDVWDAYRAALNDSVQRPTTFHHECEADLRDYWKR